MPGAYEHHLEIALEAISKASQVLLDRKDSPGVLPRKKDGTLQTSADLAAESAIVETLARQFPGKVLKGHAWLSEERELAGEGAQNQWIVDPLDGTRNYLERSGPWGTMVAFAQNQTVRVGVLALPEQEIVLAAVRGGGVHLNGKPWAPPRRDGRPRRVRLFYDTYADRFKPLADLHRENYRPYTESAAESRCSADTFYQLAVGQIDLAIEYLATPWDDAVGSLVVEELGGKVVDFQGHRWSPQLKRVESDRWRVGEDRAGHRWGLATPNLLAALDASLLDEFLPLLDQGEGE